MRTTSPRTRSRAPGCSPPRRRPTRTAARAGPRPRTRSNGRWTPSPRGWVSILPRSDAATSSRQTRSRTRRAPDWCSTAATTNRRSTGRSRWSATTTRRQEQRDRRAAGSTKHLGIGLSSYVEMCGLAPSRILSSLKYAAGGWESATVRALPTGRVQVVTGTCPHGQGHETCWSMIVADQLGVGVDDIDVLHSDTAIAPNGMDSYGSRSLAVGGTAVFLATERVLDEGTGDRRAPPRGRRGGPRVRRRRVRRAGHAGACHGVRRHRLRRVHRPRPARRDGAGPRGDDQLGPAQLHVPVRHPRVRGRGRRGDRRRSRSCATSPSTTAATRSTRSSSRASCTVASCRASRRRSTRKRSTTPTATCRPRRSRSTSSPPPRSSTRSSSTHTVTPSPTNPLGVKGIGEAGTIASTPAVMNAVVDALSPMGVRDVTMPASPQHVWDAIRTARGGSS